MAENRTAPLSVRLSPELNIRLEDCAKKLRMKKHTLAQDAIEAAVEAIEANGYKLVVPVKFDVTHVAVPVGNNPSPPSSSPGGGFPAQKVPLRAEKFSSGSETQRHK